MRLRRPLVRSTRPRSSPARPRRPRPFISLSKAASPVAAIEFFTAAGTRNASAFVNRVGAQAAGEFIQGIGIENASRIAGSVSPNVIAENMTSISNLVRQRRPVESIISFLKAREQRQLRR